MPPGFSTTKLSFIHLIPNFVASHKKAPPPMKLRSSLLFGFSSLFLNACLPSIDPFSDSGTENPNPAKDPEDHQDPAIPLTEDPLDQGNRFRSSDIKKVLFAGPFLSTRTTDNEEMLVTNVGEDGKEISTLEVEVDVDGTVYKILLPARLQKVVDIDAKFFAILRYRSIGNELPDAHLVRKSDGKAWKISADAVNPGSFRLTEVEGESRIYFTADDDSYQSMDFWKKRSGDSLSLARVFENKDEVILVSVMKTSLDDYELVGPDSVATDGSSSEDTWISKVTSRAPVPYSLKALNSSFTEYFFANNNAFRLTKTGVVVELRHMVEHPVYGELVGKVEKNTFDDLYWGLKVGDFFVLKGWRNLIVLSNDLKTIVAEPEFVQNMQRPLEIEEKGGIASIFDNYAVCQFRQIGAEIKDFCVKNDALALRGTITAIDVDEAGRIFAFSTIESVQDVEKLTIELNAQTQVLEVTKREPVQAYSPEQTVLVPVKI